MFYTKISYLYFKLFACTRILIFICHFKCYFHCSR